MQKKVSIITVHYNQQEATIRLLDSVRALDYPHIEMIVADNGSADNLGEIMRRRYPEFKYVRSERNLGFAGGNNLGIEAATGDYLFFVNNDARVTPESVGILVDFLEKNPTVGAVSPLICYDERDSIGRDIIQYAGMTDIHPITGRNRTEGAKASDRGQFSEPFPTAYAHGAAMMVTRATLAKVGPMSEDYFLYYEELDWCERIRKAGFEIWVAPQARVYHAESLTMQKLGAKKTFYLTRNRIWFMRKWSQGWRLFAFYAYMALIAAPLHSIRRLVDGEVEPLRAFWKGLIQGFNHPVDSDWSRS